MWAYESNFYQIYPLGFCGAPKDNDGSSAPAGPFIKLFGFFIHRYTLPECSE